MHGFVLNFENSINEPNDLQLFLPAFLKSKQFFSKLSEQLIKYALLWHFRNKMPRPNYTQSLKFSWCIWNGLYLPQNARKENLQVININKQRFAMRSFSDFYLSNERANKEFRPYFLSAMSLRRTSKDLNSCHSSSFFF